MEKFIDHCCVECTHTPKAPCSDFIRCCVEGPICHENQACTAKRRALINKVALNEQYVIC